MKLKLGRIGVSEAVSAAAAAMCVNGIFDIDSDYAYSKGNSTYLSVPLSVGLSLLVFLLAAAVMQKRGLGSFFELLRFAFGRAGGAVAALFVCASLIYCAARPLGSITQALDGLVYDGVKYTALFALIFPAAVFIAYHGLEMISRTAKVFAGVLLVSAAAAVLCSLPGQQSYRLYPLLGDGAAHSAGFAASHGLCFLPPLIALLTAGEGLHGVIFAKRAGAYASAAAAAVCFVLLFMLARVYSYKALSGIFMPLCRVSYLSLERNYVMWLDKLLVMAWLNGCILSAAYCIYGAALLYAMAFGQRDVGPAVISVSLCVMAFALFERYAGSKLAGVVLRALTRYGVLLAFAPAAAATVIASIKKTKKGELPYEKRIRIEVR